MRESTKEDEKRCVYFLDRSLNVDCGSLTSHETVRFVIQIVTDFFAQVIKNQQQIEMHQQQQQQQQQLLQQSSQQPQLIGSGTITVATNAPNLAEIFNHQELLAQIQQMDSNFAKTFPDFAEKAIEKEMRAMQQVTIDLRRRVTRYERCESWVCC